MNAIRFLGGAIGGIACAVGIWMLVVPIHPIFGQLSLSGLAVPIIAGVGGGFVSGVAAPHHKIRFAVITGVALTALLLAFMLRHGPSHLERNPLLWYWPIWLVPAFAIGGFLSRRFWRAV
jgi:hypothetical protein